MTQELPVPSGADAAPAPERIDVLWFLPTHGDSRYLGTTKGGRAVVLPCRNQVATANDSPVSHASGETIAGAWTMFARIDPVGQSNMSQPVGRHSDTFDISPSFRAGIGPVHGSTGAAMKASRS